MSLHKVYCENPRTCCDLVFRLKEKEPCAIVRHDGRIFAVYEGEEDSSVVKKRTLVAPYHHSDMIFDLDQWIVQARKIKAEHPKVRWWLFPDSDARGQWVLYREW